MALFGKPEPQKAPPTTNLSVPPTEKVITMQTQGLSNNQIIQSLQRDGYDSGIILDAMNQSELKNRVNAYPQYDEQHDLKNPMQFAPQFGPPTTEAPTDAPPPFEPDKDLPPLDREPLPAFQPELAPEPSGPVEQMSMERIEEIAEAIIDEKWNEIARSINKIIDWKDRTEEKIAKIEQMFVDMRHEFDNLNKGVLGKIGDYDKHLGDLGVEIKAMEKVFQNIIPTMTENVHALEKIAQKMGKE